MTVLLTATTLQRRSRGASSKEDQKSSKLLVGRPIRPHDNNHPALPGSNVTSAQSSQPQPKSALLQETNTIQIEAVYYHYYHNNNNE